MESYRELRDRQQKEFNELPLGFAFSDKQFDEMMEKWGLDPEKDLDKIYRVPGGGFIQKKDHEHFHEVLDRHNVEMEAAKAADEDGTGFLYQMFKYELDNHEYGYTGDFEDTLDSLGLTWEEVAASPRLLKALDKASSEIRKRERRYYRRHSCLSCNQSLCIGLQDRRPRKRRHVRRCGPKCRCCSCHFQRT